MSKEYKKPNFLFRAVMIFIVAALIIINIVLTYSANTLIKDMENLTEELKRERLECESLRQRLEKEMTDAAIEEEAKELGYKNPDDIIFEADVPNS